MFVFTIKATKWDEDGTSEPFSLDQWISFDPLFSEEELAEEFLMANIPNVSPVPGTLGVREFEIKGMPNVAVEVCRLPVITDLL